MKVLSEERKYSAQDFERLPEGPPYYQLIEGALIMSPAPSYSHQRTVGKVFLKLSRLLEEKGQGEVLISSIDVYLDEKNVFQPDIVVLLKEGKAKVEEKGIFGPPDVVVEILSPSTAYYDLIVKKEVYERAGVKEYWILDPNRKTFEIYKNTEEGLKLSSQAREKGKVLSEILDLEIDLKDIYEGGI
ncbi:Uma2 family endonuclease [Thermocrinis sp.]|jgi:Uma2 family endonuclease|uniref:Uma2 family endonuclease n=1 Tax=Thermocrinis sp. TaxID=2024383 RepID=UPI003C127AA7